MYQKIIDELKDKKIVILGYGLEGKSTHNFLKKYLPTKNLTIMDQNYQNYQNVIDIDYEKLNDFDIIMKSPGISLKNHPNIDKTKITSQAELLMKHKDCTIIGVTGTKGKSTTTTLIYEIIKNQKNNVYLMGNIGKPIFDEITSVNKNSIIVLELSSHQLEYMQSSPNIAIILNFFEEHLDHYNSIDSYYQAKLNICKYQNQNDYLLYTSDNQTLNNYIKKTKIKSQKINITDTKQNNSSVYIKDNYIYNPKKLYNTLMNRKLKGNHNLKNIMFALEVAFILKLDIQKAVEVINNFKPLPHRMELVGKYQNIIYYNDSIATIPQSTINSIETLKNVNTLIIGGMDRKINYQDFINYLNSSNIENIICLPTTGHEIAKNLNKKTYIVNTLKEAVKTAKNVTKKDTICLLSPAAASYGFFKNFQERGNLYKEYIRNEEIK